MQVWPIASCPCRQVNSIDVIKAFSAAGFVPVLYLPAWLLNILFVFLSRERFCWFYAIFLFCFCFDSRSLLGCFLFESKNLLRGNELFWLWSAGLLRSADRWLSCALLTCRYLIFFTSRRGIWLYDPLLSIWYGGNCKRLYRSNQAERILLVQRNRNCCIAGERANKVTLPNNSSFWER